MRSRGRAPCATPKSRIYKAFNAKKIDPDVGNGFPWDPTLIVIDGLRKLGTNTDAKSLLAYIESAHGLAGINGIQDYRARRPARRTHHLADHREMERR